MIQDYLTSLRRALYFRLVIPILRSRASPQHLALGVAAGLAVGCTPTVGIQMVLVTGLWSLMRFTPYRFNLPVSIAWTWVSNPLTVLPIYYVFMQTGALLMGVEGAASMAEVEQLFIQDEAVDSSIWDSIKQTMNFLADKGLILSIGCLPYLVLSSLAGYFLTLKLLSTRRVKKS